MNEIIIYIFLTIIVVFNICALMYIKFGWFKSFYHNIIGWHKPLEKQYMTGTNIISTCEYCGKEIMKDSQGNWFLSN